VAKKVRRRRRHSESLGGSGGDGTYPNGIIAFARDGRKKSLVDLRESKGNEESEGKDSKAGHVVYI
jgi:hypothetical protein